jgi:methionyl-tRNA formyltransferase
MRTIFLGTGWESLETLKVLYNNPDFEVVCVITTPDKKVGRDQIMTSSKVKQYALEKNIPVVHTEKKKDNYIKALKKYNPDIAVCKAFGEIIPKEFLVYPKYGCINIHFSILPKYRGAVPIQKAILEGEKETGISIMLMSEGLDEGDILKIIKEEIRPEDTNISLRKRLVKKSTEILVPTIKKWVTGEITPTPQNNKDATYCWQKDISKEKAQIIWPIHPPEYIERMVRAFLPWPVAWTKLNENLPDSIAGKRMKIFKVELVKLENERDPGELFTKNDMVLFSTKDPFTVLRVKSFQIAGKKKTNEKEFLNGIKGSL